MRREIHMCQNLQDSLHIVDKSPFFGVGGWFTLHLLNTY